VCSHGNILLWTCSRMLYSVPKIQVSNTSDGSPRRGSGQAKARPVATAGINKQISASLSLPPPSLLVRQHPRGGPRGSRRWYRRLGPIGGSHPCSSPGAARPPALADFGRLWSDLTARSGPFSGELPPSSPVKLIFPATSTSSVRPGLI
jgi:hypothetical protein